MSREVGNRLQKLGLAVEAVGILLFVAGAISVGALPTGFNMAYVPLGLLAALFIFGGLILLLIGSWIGADWLRLF